MPLVLPVAVIVGLVAYVLNISRIFLSGHGHIPIIVGSVITVMILLGATLLSAGVARLRELGGHPRRRRVHPLDHVGGLARARPRAAQGDRSDHAAVDAEGRSSRRSRSPRPRAARSGSRRRALDGQDRPREDRRHRRRRRAHVQRCRTRPRCSSSSSLERGRRRRSAASRSSRSRATTRSSARPGPRSRGHEGHDHGDGCRR